MRVVHVVRQFFPGVGGLEGAVHDLCIALNRKGVEASVVTLDRIAKQPGPRLPAAATVDGIAVRRIPAHGSSRYPVAPAVLAHLREADVVHVHAIDFFFDFLAVTRPLHGKPLIASTHGGFFHTAFAQRVKQIYFATVTRAAARAYSTICASSQTDHALFRRIAPGNVALVENGTDTAKWRDVASRTPVRSLLCLGRFSSNKQIDALFPLLAQLRLRHPDWRLTIAGRPWDVTRDTLAREAAVHGVDPAVRILESPDDDAIAGAIGACSYLISASRHEGFGIGVVEGLSAGLVPILNRIPPFEAMLSKAGCGLLIEADQPSTSAARIEAFHQATAPESDRTRTACLTAARSYSWDAAAELFLRHYARAAATGRSFALDTGPHR